MANRKNLSCTMLLPGIRDDTRQADPYSIRQDRAHAYWQRRTKAGTTTRLIQ